MFAGEKPQYPYCASRRPWWMGRRGEGWFGRQLPGPQSSSGTKSGGISASNMLPPRDGVNPPLEGVNRPKSG
jgi:hypothetical protein